jgi:class I lanthipeptide synthase
MGAWRPLLAGEPAQEAWQAVLDVAAALKSPPPVEEEDADPGIPAWSVGVANGAAGLSLLFSYLAEASADDAWADDAMAYLDPSMEALATLPMPPGLYGGFAGVAWTIEHLRGWLFESQEEEGDGPVLDALVALLDRGDWPGEYDLIDGLVGFGVYALEALPRPAARRCLELVVEHLERLAEERSPGVAWYTPPERMPAHHRALAPAGYYNLGVAHGTPGAIGLLAEIHGAGIARDRALPLLDRAVAWLLAQPWDSGGWHCFPHYVYGGVAPHVSRLAWCYGDPGIAAVLLLAARRAGRADWEREAVEIALRAARRPPETASVQDVGLCHGAAGLGHLFNRLYQATGEEELATAARFWFRRTLEMRRPGEGVAGFCAWETPKGGWTSRRGFLTGAAGTALALLGAVSAVEPEWDRLLLTAVPAQATGNPP